MGRKMLEIKTLHKLSIDRLIEIANTVQNSYTRSLAQAVIMRFTGYDNEMIEDIRNVVTTTVPSDFGYEQSKWNCVILTRYIEEEYGKTYSDTWLRHTLKSLDFTYKRGVYKPTLANPALQESRQS